jgi:hypothetical protein
VSTRIRVILLSVLLVVALGGTCLAGSATIQAFHSWQQQEKQFKVGDVRLISYWMTIPHISRIYHVPENYLYQSLHIKKETTTRSKTLAMIATEKHKSVDEIIHETQIAVEAYRKLHPIPTPSPVPTAPPHRTVLSLAAVYEREQPSITPIICSLSVDAPLSSWYKEGDGGRGNW